MKQSFLYRICIALLCTTSAFAAGSGVAGSNAASAASNPAALKTYGNLPLSFEANQGQTDKQIDFLSHGTGYTLFLKNSEAVLKLRSSACMNSPQLDCKSSAKESRQTESVLRMKLEEANQSSRGAAQDELPGKANYFFGQDASQWHTNVSTYKKVKYSGVYPGIDLVYYGNQRQLEHDFIVAPGADPKAIRLRFEGATKSSINRDGKLVLNTPAGDVVLKRPTIYQEIGGSKRLIDGRYLIEKNHQIGFNIAAYDTSIPLVIDPVLSYVAYLGGANYPAFGDQTNLSKGIAVDNSGSAYIVGETDTTDFPLARVQFGHPNSSQLTGFVTKLTADGSALVYSTYFAGIPNAVAVDNDGNAYIAGRVFTSLPLVNALYTAPANNFVSKFNSAGSALLYSTYFLGTSPAPPGSRYQNEIKAIAVDLQGDAYITGSVTDSMLPVVNGLQSDLAGAADAFLSEINPDGSALLLSTYLGGSGDDVANGIALDSSENIYLAGQTNSSDFPTKNSFQAKLKGAGSTLNAFVTKLAAGGSTVIYSTYFGSTTAARGVAVDSEAHAYITGSTGPQLPLLNSLYPAGDPSATRAFVTEFDSNGSALVYSTYLGDGKSGDVQSGISIAVDGDENAFVAGDNQEGDFPQINPLQPAVPKATGFGSNAFVAKILKNASTVAYSAYVSSGIVSSIALDSKDSAYVTGSGATVTNLEPFEPQDSTPGDAFVLKIEDNPRQATDLSVSNVPIQAIIGVGGEAKYIITATNLGPVSAPNVVINDYLAPGTGLISCTFMGQACARDQGGNPAISIANLSVGATEALSLVISTPETAGDYNTVTNTTTISSSAPEAVPANNTATSTVTIRETSDIAISVSVDNSHIGQLSYLVKVANQGPDNAHAVLLQFPVPVNATFVSATPGDPNLVTCSLHTTLGINGVVRCSVGSQGKNTVEPISFLVNTSGTPCSTVTETVSVVSKSIDSVSANDSTTTTTQLPGNNCPAITAAVQR